MKLPQTKICRYGLILPLAALVTVGLGLVMQSVAAAEFVTQPTDRDKPNFRKYFSANPLISCGLHGEDHGHNLPIGPSYLLPKNKVTVDRFIVKNPHDDSESYVPPKPDIGHPRLNLSAFSISSTQVDSGPFIGRIPPAFPAKFMNGDHSGFCRVRFSINESGRTFDVTADQCTNDLLKDPSIESVKRWQYNPISHPRSGEETTIRFNLLDENGEFLPFPEGY